MKQDNSSAENFRTGNYAEIYSIAALKWIYCKKIDTENLNKA